MTNAVDRITSYDFLGIFVPGSVGLAMIVAKWFPNLLIENPKIICCGCKIMSENTTLMTTIQMLMFLLVRMFLVLSSTGFQMVYGVAFGTIALSLSCRR